MKNYEYEEDLDILYISNNPDNEKAVGNLIFGNIIIDIGENGKVLGIEIDCASKLFNFSPEQFNSIKLARIQTMKIGNILTMGIFLETPIKEHIFQFAIPQENKIPITC